MAVTMARDPKKRATLQKALHRWTTPAIFGRSDAKLGWAALFQEIAAHGARSSGQDELNGYRQYLEQPSRYLFGLLPLMLRARASSDLPSDRGTSQCRCDPTRVRLGTEEQWIAYQQVQTPNTKGHARLWLVAFAAHSRAACSRRLSLPATAHGLESLQIFGPATRAHGSRLVTRWAGCRIAGRRHPVLALISVAPGTMRVRLSLVQQLERWGNILPSVGRVARTQEQPMASGVLVEDELLPRHSVLEVPSALRNAWPPSTRKRRAHLSVTRELQLLQGDHRWRSSFCCAVLATTDAARLLPQLGESGDMLWIGVAEREGSREARRANETEKKVGKAGVRGDVSKMHAFYAMRPQAPFELVALSPEFCLAPSTQRGRRRRGAAAAAAASEDKPRQLLDGGLQPSCVDLGGDSWSILSLAFSAPPSRRKQPAAAAEHSEGLVLTVAASSGQRALDEAGSSVELLRFPAAILSAMLQPAVSTSLGVQLKVDGLR
eukprot:TRINITY_DN54716_c0_g1_i1.p1 TRINITY_DN54716_c0_g1~~TRINITY_DN54716_c0_g1_i1.p1  ORF type:complete len:561 (-),score=78.11 TRINITY_DN54716_c0_g1_i1:103-1578(-)